MNSVRPKELFSKITLFIVGSTFITIVLIIRLFQLQVLSHGYYQDMATRGQYGLIELPAQRGEILIKDFHSDEQFPLATNITLNLLYADPTIIKDPFYITTNIGPLLFDIEEQRARDEERIREQAKNLSAETTPEELEILL